MEQLSLPLTLPSAYPEKVSWFQNILESLGINRSLAWPDLFGVSLRHWLNQQGYTPIKTLSLFSGGGGLDIAFHDAGFDIVQMVELKAQYVQTLKKTRCQENGWKTLNRSALILENFFPLPI